ncbi:MAG: protein kinase domain-containing protein [Anaerolineales bacterium]
MPLERGTLLNKRYRIIEILGQGGMGSVYRAIDENLGVDVAVKENLFTTEEYARQFRREATLLASLRHPNLPRVTDHFEITDRGQYLIMDYIEGEDLRERMDREGILPEDEMIIVGMAMCDALTYLHSRKPQVVHRDVKPGNVKIAPDGRIFLVDFGLAKVVQGSQATTTGARAMTPGYSPPEQYGTARTDHRSDIYSLGATLYAALTATLPEDGLARAMEQTELTPVRKQNPKISRRAAAMIEKALSVQPDARYQSADEFKQALYSAANTSVRRATGALTISPPPAIDDDELEVIHNNGSENASQSGLEAEAGVQNSIRPVNRPTASTPIPQSRPRPRRRNNMGCLMYFVILLGLVLGGGWLAYTYMPGFRQQVNALVGPVAPTQYAEVFTTPTPSPTLTEDNLVAIAPASPTPEISATPEANLTPTQTPEPDPTEQPAPTQTPENYPTEEPAFLGNSNGQVAFVSDRTGIPQIWLINVDGVRYSQLTEMPGGACQPDWSPDGQRLIFISPCPDRRELYLGSQLWSIRADGTGLATMLGQAAGDYDPDWSPDGTRIVFTSLRQTGKPQIYVLNIDDGDFEPLATEGLKNMQPTWSPDGSQIIYVSTQEMGERLWIMNADGSGKRPLTEPEPIANYPNWSSDGITVIYTRRDNIGALPDLYIGELGEDFFPTQLSEDGSPRRDAQISPDGLWIVYEGWPDGSSHDIWITNLEGTESRVLVNSPFYDFNPAWRPFVSSP